MSAKNYLCPFCENRYYGIHELNRHIEDEHNAPILTDQQILEKAIAKAIEGGWIPFNNEYQATQKPESIFTWLLDGNTYEWNKLAVYSFIFDRDFAKALWGEELVGGLYYMRRLTDKKATYAKYMQSNWQYHLQTMVIADDPVLYLRENI